MEGVTPEQLLDTPDLIAVGVAGDEVRRQKHGARTTFNRVFEVHVDAPIQSLPPRVAAGEFRIVGKPASLDALVEAARAAAAVAGGTPVTVSSVGQLLRLQSSLRTVAEALRDAGVTAVAQLPLGDVREAEAVARELEAAGLPVLTLTVEELPEDRLTICHDASRLQAAVGGFRAFAPLPRTMSIARPTTGYDDVKMIALARTVVTHIDSIQVDWALYGPKLAQVALTVGADDVDNVSAVDPGILGTRRSPLEEIKGNITAASLEPLERDALFRVNSKRQTPTAKEVQ